MSQFFGEGSWCRSPCSRFYICLPLKPHVLALSPKAMEALLRSDSLQVTTENEVYTLLTCWLRQSSHTGEHEYLCEVSEDKWLPLYSRLVKFVRVQHLSLEYVANVITACYLAVDSGFLPSMLRSSLLWREKDAEEEGADLVPRDRGHDSPVWNYTTTLALADLLSFDDNSMTNCLIGLVDGCPMRIAICRDCTEKCKKSRFGIFVYAIMPYNEAEVPLYKGLSRGMRFEFQLQIGDVAREWTRDVFDDDTGFGYGNLSKKPWEEIVHENSTYFPDGQVTVKLRTRLPKKVYKRS